MFKGINIGKRSDINTMKSGGDDFDMKSLTILNPDILPQEILKYLYVDLLESPSSVTLFAAAWHRACSVEPIWHTLDLSMLRSDYIKLTCEPHIYVSSKSDRALTILLNLVLDFSQGNITTMIFHYNLFISNDQFVYTAQRCPWLRRLVFVSWNRITKAGMCKAIRGWKDLESITMPTIPYPHYFFKEISMHCKNFKELKVMGPFLISIASSLSTCLPNLKVLSLRCSMLYKDALILILDRLQHLQVLNISHCFLAERLPPDRFGGDGDEGYRVLEGIDTCIHQKASRLREFLTCMKDSCIMCQRTRMDEGLPRWYKYEQGIWKAALLHFNVAFIYCPGTEIQGQRQKYKNSGDGDINNIYV